MDQILVKPNELKDTSPAGIYLGAMEQDRPQQGTVIATGPGTYTKNGTLIPVALNPGDGVMYGKFCGISLNLNGKEVLMLKEMDIFAVVEKE